MVVIKINEVPTGGPSALKSRAERAWRITPAKIAGQTKAIVLHRGIILEEYEIKFFQQDQQEPDRIAFDLTIVPNSSLKGLKIDYPTSYPCTITNKLIINV